MPTIVVHGENDLVVPFESALGYGRTRRRRAVQGARRLPLVDAGQSPARRRHDAPAAGRRARRRAARRRAGARDHGRARRLADAADPRLTPALTGGQAASTPSASRRSNTSKWTGCARRTEQPRRSSGKRRGRWFSLAPQTCASVNGRNCRHRLASGLASRPSDRIGHGRPKSEGMTRWTARCRTSR